MYKKINAMVLSALLVASPLLTYSPRSEATGIPTIDIAALVQKLLDYAQQLNDYAEQLYQSQVVANEYIQKLKEMEQIYTEYEHTLEQIKGIKDYVDNEEWKEILSRIDIDFPLNPLDSHWGDWDVDIYTDDGVIDVDDAVSRVYKRIRKLDDVYEDIETVFDSEDVRDQQREEARRQFVKSREATQQKYAAEVFTKESENLAIALNELKINRENIAMDDESELRTLQMLAMQQELELHYRKAQNDVLIKSFEMSNQESIERKNKESYVYDMQLLDKLEVASQDPYEADEDRVYSAGF